jgi:ABC-2 type transport system ATP-binding protein
MYIIETTDLTKYVGERKKSFKAVDGINIRVKEREIHGFLGPNGAGKSTTIKMLTGAIFPSSGTALINGCKAGTLEAKMQIGYLPERPSFYTYMTALSYTALMARFYGMDKSSALNRAKDVLQWVGLKDSMERKIKGFSAGMLQRLGFAQAIVGNSPLIILDEPTSNLDPIGRSEFIEMIKSLKKGGLSVFISTHILSEMEQMADTITIINNGRILVESSVEELRGKVSSNVFVLDTSDNVKVANFIMSYYRGYIRDLRMEGGKIRIDAADTEACRQIISAIPSHLGVTLKSFSEERESLENLFKKIVRKGGDH